MNATKTERLTSISIEIKGQHIREGNPEDNRKNAMALAFKEYPGCTFVEALEDVIYVKIDGNHYRLPTTAAAETFMRGFNRGHEVHPATFVLEVDNEDRGW